MTPSEWISLAGSEMRAELKAGNSINDATAEVLASLLPGWEESTGVGISCSILVNDILEVAHNLRSIYSILSHQLPSALDELAAIK
jgi:hypothetical protein